MARFLLKIGDVFRAQIDGGRYKYFQYVLDDATQLNSEVVRVFEKDYSNDDDVGLKEIIAGDVDFFAHVVCKIGVKLGVWEKVGNEKNVGKVTALFRQVDLSELQMPFSNKWWVWKANEDMKFVGELSGVYKNAELGIVVNPNDLVDRMNTGSYKFDYPRSN